MEEVVLGGGKVLCYQAGVEIIYTKVCRMDRLEVIVELCIQCIGKVQWPCTSRGLSGRASSGFHFRS